MTLLLTCLTPDFAVQTSDRRLTRLNGEIVEEAANKATLVGNYMSYAYTGLSVCAIRKPTDELLLESMGQQGNPVQLMEGLAEKAAKGIRNLPLGVQPSKRRMVRRTSFVGCGFVGLRNPESFGRSASHDDLHPLLVVVSNAQGIDEVWRSEADWEFSVSHRWLSADSPFLLHVAGQPLRDEERNALERELRRALKRQIRPESIARLLTRTVRAVSARNVTVGPNVMNLITRRADVFSTDISPGSGFFPVNDGDRSESGFFRFRDDNPARWIYSPVDAMANSFYGPNIAYPGQVMMKGIFVGREGEVPPGLLDA